MIHLEYVENILQGIAINWYPIFNIFIKDIDTGHFLDFSFGSVHC